MEDCVKMFASQAKWDLNWESAGKNALASTISLAQEGDKRQAGLKELICALVTLGANGRNLPEADQAFVKSVLNES